MIHKVSKSLMFSLAAGVLGCGDLSTYDEFSGDVGFRCFGGGSVGFIGLNSTEVTGSAHISGSHNSVFSNNLVDLSGSSYRIEGDAISGGVVNVTGGGGPDGDIIENAGTITVADPTPDVQAARHANDNHKIPCVKKGKSCVSPVSNWHLNANADVTLTTGVYYFENVKFNGKAKLNIDGDVTIYLAGAATFNGGASLNPSGDSLKVVSSTTDLIKVNGNSNSEMVIHAPLADVRINGTAELTGGVLANNLTITGTADLHGTADMTNGSGVTCTSAGGHGGAGSGSGGGGGGTGGSGSGSPPDLPELPD